MIAGRSRHAACRSTATTSTTSSASCTSTDLVKALRAARTTSTPAALAREALTVPETLGADDLLAEMRRRGTREALVIDEYGGTAGLVTFETLMERIVGDLGGDRRGRRAVTMLAGRLGRHRRPGARVATSTSSSACTSTRTPTRRSAATCWAAGPPAGRRDTVEADGQTLTVVALDGIRVARVRIGRRVNPEA